MHTHTSSTPSNRRGSARSPLFMQVFTGDGEAIFAWDIGLGGLKARGKKTRLPGQYVDLEFTLPQTKTTLKLGGQVTTIDSYREGTRFGVELGIRFCRISDTDQIQLYRFLDKRRALWAGKSRLVANSTSSSYNEERPFHGLLLEAFNDLRCEELNSTMTKHGPSRELRMLSRVLSDSTGELEVLELKAAA